MANEAGKYLTFAISEEEYAISISNVLEILSVMPITKAPNLPEFLKGLINLRGKIIPIIDLRLRLGLDEREYDDRTSIIIVESQTPEGKKSKGIVVDEVKEVLILDAAAIDNTPKFDKNFNQEFFTGIGKLEEQVVLLLDVDKILTIE